MKTTGCDHVTYRASCAPCCKAHEVRLAALAQLSVFAAQGINPRDLFPGPVEDEPMSDDMKRAWEAEQARREALPADTTQNAARAFHRAATRRS